MRDAVACSASLEPEPETGSYFVSAYPPFDSWTASELPAFEAALDRPPDEGTPLGLYVHIPFCEQRCDYCYYLSYEAGTTVGIDDYVSGLGRELALYARRPRLADRAIAFVYFGGGTPSLLSEARLERLLGDIEPNLAATPPPEVTFECAPRSITPAKLERLRAFGVDRLSIGVQQLDDEILRRNGRLHLVADVERAFAAARETGFPQINLDLIVGLVGETDASFLDSLDAALAMRPESLTIYQLEIPHNTPLFRDLLRQGLPSDLPDWPTKRDRLALAWRSLRDAGYHRRSAYTAVRDPERHGFIYQDAQYRGADVLGIGASSFAYIGGVHQQNVASLEGYLRAMAAGDRLPLGRAHALSDAERFVREWVLQAKLGRLERAYFVERFGIDPWQRFSEEIGAFETRGWISRDDERLLLTEAGLLRVDRLVRDFYLPEHRGAAATASRSRTPQG